MTTNDNESMPEAPFGLKYLIMDADISRETAIREKPTATFGYTPMQWMYADGENANWHVLDWRKAQCDAIIDKMIEQQSQMGIKTSREKAINNIITNLRNLPASGMSASNPPYFEVEPVLHLYEYRPMVTARTMFYTSFPRQVVAEEKANGRLE